MTFRQVYDCLPKGADLMDITKDRSKIKAARKQNRKRK